MKKKQLKAKKPRTRRAPVSRKQSKDKSVKQNVNVNVTSSGGGGSGGSSIPSSIPPMVYSSMQGQKVGENVELKKLTDLLQKQFLNKPTETLPKKEPIPYYEDEKPLEVKIESKPNNSNLSLLEQINTTKVQDDAATVNNNDVVDESLFVNNPDEYIEEPVFKKYEEQDYKFNKTEKNKLKKVIENSYNTYKELGLEKIGRNNKYKLQIDEYGPYLNIEGTKIPWNSQQSKGPRKDDLKKLVRNYYGENKDLINVLTDDSFYVISNNE